MGNNRKRCTIVMLPINGLPEDNYRGFMIIEGVLYAYAPKSMLKSADKWQVMHLYLVSNDEIKEGDYWWMSFTNRLEKCTAPLLLPEEVFNPNLIGGHKVVATTDKSLGLPLIPQDVVSDYAFFCGRIRDAYVKTKILNPEVIELTDNNEVILIDGFSVV